MNVLDVYFGYLEKISENPLPGNFLKLCTIRKFYKNTLRHVKTTTLYLYLEQKLHSNEMFYKICVPLGDTFLTIEIESIGTIISKQYFASSD